VSSQSTLKLEDLDVETRALAEASARRAGVSVDAWLNAALGTSSDGLRTAAVARPPDETILVLTETITPIATLRLQQVVSAAAHLSDLLPSDEQALPNEEIPKFLRQPFNEPRAGQRLRRRRRCRIAAAAFLLISLGGLSLGHPSVSEIAPVALVDIHNRATVKVTTTLKQIQSYLEQTYARTNDISAK
jgi:hypothetical protein